MSKINIKVLIEQAVERKLGEGKTPIDKSYTHFLFDKKNKKILNGWDYSDYKGDNESIKHYFKGDLQDMDLPKNVPVTLLTKQGLKKYDITDPYDSDNWAHLGRKVYNDNGELVDDVKEATTTLITPDGKTLTPAQQAQVKAAKPGDAVKVTKAGQLAEEDKDKFLTSKQVSRMASKAGQIVPDAETDLLELAIAYKDKIPAEKVSAVLAEYDIDKKDLASVQIPTGPKWLTLDQLAAKGLLEDKKEEKEAEETPTEPAPVEQSLSSISAELGKHIASAIDAAAKCIQDTGDKKYENTLGKVVKHLTSAQSALDAVQAHEQKLSEQAAKEDEKSTAKYTKALRTALKGSFKNPQHIEQVVKKYQKVIKASKDKDPGKLAEVIVAHALKEGFDKA